MAQLINKCSSLEPMLQWVTRQTQQDSKTCFISVKYAFLQVYTCNKICACYFGKVTLQLYKNRQLENDYPRWIFCQFGKEPIKFLLPLFGGWTSTDQFVASMDNFTKESYSSNFFSNCMTDNTYSISGLTQEDRHFVFQCLEGRFLSRQQK